MILLILCFIYYYSIQLMVLVWVFVLGIFSVVSILLYFFPQHSDIYI